MLQITIVKVLSLSTLVVVPLALLFLRPENPELMLSQNRMGLYKSRQERVRQVCRQYNVSQSSKKVPYFCKFFLQFVPEISYTYVLI
jgi:hypothetical protein